MARDSTTTFTTKLYFFESTYSINLKNNSICGYIYFSKTEQARQSVSERGVHIMLWLKRRNTPKSSKFSSVTSNDRMPLGAKCPGPRYYVCPEAFTACLAMPVKSSLDHVKPSQRQLNCHHNGTQRNESSSVFRSILTRNNLAPYQIRGAIRNHQHEE